MSTSAHTIMSTNALDATNYHSGTALEIREYHYTTTSNGTGMDQAPRIGFHWGGRVQRQLGLNASGNLVTSNNGTNWYELIHAGNISSQNVSYANSAGSVAWNNVSGKPSTFTPSSHTHDYLPLSGGTMSGNISFSNSGTGFRGINYGTMGDNDQWRIGGAATGSNAGYMEIATADDGTEPIYVRQYTGVFGSLKRTATLLDANGNTTFPGTVTATSFSGTIPWGNVSGKPGASGNATTPVYWNGSGFTNCTAYGSASVNYANSAGSATNVPFPYSSQSHYGSTSNTSYYKININSKTSWMLSFIVRVYQGYESYDIRFSGYNYGSNHWYSPSASLLDSTTSSITVYFGYDANWELWVAVPGSSYSGVSVYNAVNGYTQVNLTEKSLFTVSAVNSLGGTIQSTQTIYRPLKTNEAAGSVSWSNVTDKPSLVTNSYGSMLTINSWPGLEIVNTNRNNGETGLRVRSLDSAGNNNIKAYFGWLSSQGAYVYNAACGKYLALNDAGTPHVSGTVLLTQSNWSSYINPYSSSSQPGYTVSHSGWSYSRYYSGSNFWDIGTNQSAGGWGSNGGFGIRENGADNNGIYVKRNTSSYGKLCVGTPSGECSIGYYVGGSAKWTVGCSDGTNFGFYQGSSGGWKVTIDTAGSVYSNSDRHKKKDIQSIDRRSLSDLFDISDKLLKQFTWKDSGKKSYGFIAQQLEKYVPEAVTQDNKGVKSVSYDIAYAKILASIVNEIKKLRGAKG